ncbi:MAG: hypothetical protein ABI388_01360 [Bacteroidia bacterium]
MKKILFLSIFALGCFNVKAQLNPVKNFYYGSQYNFPTYSNCPGYNCFKLTWSKPDTSLTDTLIGYKIYHNDILYQFVTDTFFGCLTTNQCTAGSANWYANTPFWITVKAVYNKTDSITSLAKDSTYIAGVTISIDKINVKRHVAISPNPFSLHTTLQIDNELTNATVTVYNSIGQQVKQIKKC